MILLPVFKKHTLSSNKMKELEHNLKFKNAIEDFKLQIHIVKLMKSGQRASGEIDRVGAVLTHHFETVTSKVDMNSEKRKERSYEIMAKQEAKQTRRRPATAVARTRPSKEAIYIPTVNFDPDAAREAVHTDKLGRPDLERIHRERSDKFYHHKIETLMTMMRERTKKRAKSAPSTRPIQAPQYTINNLPETILEDKLMTRNDAEFELKKMRASAMITKDKVFLYGEEIDPDGTVNGKGGAGGSGGGSGRRRPESALSRSSSSQGGRGLNSRSSVANSQDRSDRQSVSRAPSRSESRSSIVGYRAKSAAQSERVSSAQEKRTTASLSRKSSFIGQKDDDSDMSSLSDSEDERILQQAVSRAPLPDQVYYNKLGKKLLDFQERKYPSRSLDPNPEAYARHKPFPEIFDVKLTQSYNKFCKKTARIKTVEQSKQELEEIVAESSRKENKEPWEPGYVYKKAWNTAEEGTIPYERAMDTGPDFQLVG